MNNSTSSNFESDDGPAVDHPLVIIVFCVLVLLVVGGFWYVILRNPKGSSDTDSSVGSDVGSGVGNVGSGVGNV